MKSLRHTLGFASAAIFAGGLCAILVSALVLLQPWVIWRTQNRFELVLEGLQDGGTGKIPDLAALRDAAAGTGFKLVLADSQGQVFRSSAPEFREGQEFPLPKEQLALFMEHRDRLDQGLVLTGSIDAAPRGQSVIQLQARLGPDGYLVITQPLAELRRAAAMVTPFFILTGGFILALQLALVLVLSRRLVSPVLGMAAVAGRMAAGDYAPRCGILRDDELGLLASTLDSLAGTLAATMSQLQQANAELERKIRLQKDFIAGASHELKTPVGLMRGYAEALQLGCYETDTERDELTAIIMKEADHLDRLVGELVAQATGKDAAIREALGDHDLAAIIAEASSRHQLQAAAKNIVLEIDLAGPLQCRVDPGRITQIMDNLLSNAFRHCPDGGTISVRLMARPRARIEVCNTGEPIPELHLPNLFEPFYQVDQARNRKTGSTGVAEADSSSGSGLGLAIVKSLAEAGGGSCGVANTPAGVLFWVEPGV